LTRILHVPRLDYKRDDEASRETQEILADLGMMAVLAKGLRELDRGGTVALADLRRELDAEASSPSAPFLGSSLQSRVQKTCKKCLFSVF
jgi:hypothetical protein